MSPPLVDHTAIDYHAPRSDPARTCTHASILGPVGIDDEQLLFPEGWKHSLRTRTMLILSSRSPSLAQPVHAHNPALQCREGGPQGPMPPQSKAICTPGKAYCAGSWRWARLLHGSISLPSCAHLTMLSRFLPTMFAQSSDISCI